MATEIDGRLYGRGSADDGGGIRPRSNSGALKALGDDLNVNIKVFIEGEEEIGSPSFIPFIEAHRDEFAADVIIVADSGNWSADIPSLTTSLRGNTCVDVTVQGLEHPVHSGQVRRPDSRLRYVGRHARRFRVLVRERRCPRRTRRDRGRADRRFAARP